MNRRLLLTFLTSVFSAVAINIIPTKQVGFATRVRRTGSRKTQVYPKKDNCPLNCIYCDFGERFNHD